LAAPWQFVRVSGRRTKARLYAYAIAVAGLVPALILASFLAINSAGLQRAQLEQNAQNQTREAVSVIERDIVAIENVLLTLARSGFLQADNLEAFYAQALNSSQLIGAPIMLRDADLDKQVLNTAFPFGTNLDGATRFPRTDTDVELLRAGKPIVTNVFFATRLGEHFVSVVVPILRNGELRYYLNAGVALRRFADLLASLDIRPDQYISVIDGNGTYVARSLDNNRYAGTTIKYPMLAGAQGVINGIDRDGLASHWFWRKSGRLGWAISVGLPDRVLEAPLNQALVSLLFAAIFLSVLALGFAHVWGGRISQAAGALGIDRKPTREEFEILFDSAPNGVMVTDEQGRIVLLNAQIRRKFGYTPAELVGASIEVLVPERFRATHAGLRQAFARDGQARRMGAGRELYARRKDGSEFPIEIGLNPINSRAGKLVLVTVIDISARKREADRLNATMTERDDLRRRLINAQEQERLRLARELHDQTGQSLTAAMLEIKALEESVDDPSRSRLRLLRVQLEQVGRTLHHVAWELRPAAIDELGLQIALSNYLAEWSDQYGIDADFHCGDLRGELSDEICTSIYRVVQEALTNVAKHAKGATDVSVVIERAAEKLQLTIEDNGCGFKDELLLESRGSRNGGLGIAGMRERLLLIGGDLEIESSASAGTTIFVRIPLRPARAAA